MENTLCKTLAEVQKRHEEKWEKEQRKLWSILTLGLKDYCEENGFADVVLGLSGGIDSALVAVLSCDALGAEHVHCLMMPAEHTSVNSIEIARKMHQLNGFSYQEINVQSLVEVQRVLLSGAINEALKPLVLENTQARARGMLLMNYANQNGYLPLACSNKSEAMVGYCTLYGDTCGGILPIGNLYKTDVYQLAFWRNEQSIVFPDEVLTREPSAELAPLQKDRDTLPEYSKLDNLLKAMQSPNFDKEEACLLAYSLDEVDKVENMVKRSAFKRKQLPPALPLKEREGRFV